MGDCRIRVLIAKDLLPTATRNNNNDDEWHAVIHVDTADATVRDVYDAVLKPLWNQETLPDNVCLWDCTLHPPKEITEWLTLFGERTGPKSQTLYDAGWFPSGTWQVLPRGTTPNRTQNYDDVQYNLPSQSTLVSSSSGVKLTKDETMTPSQVLQSVTERFPTINEDEEAKRALKVRRQRRKEQQAKEAARHAKLEERIQALGSSKKGNQAVSLQVRRMLIKSRCTGSSSLKMHDRVYLHIVIVQGEDDTKEEFRYFSQQDTVARIVSSVAKVSSPQEAELLVRRPGDADEEAVYRRLPVTMRLYEAIAEKYLQEVDAVVIRCYTPPQEEPTTSVTDTEDTEGQQSDLEVDNNEDLDDSQEEKAAASAAVPEAMETDDGADQATFDRMGNAIAEMDDAASSKSKKKASTTSDKVRTMLMKSKAKGDKKRVPKMDDRFFIELVVVKDYDGECSASISPVFLAKSDPFERILRDCVSVPSGCTATVFLPTEQGSFRTLPNDVSLQGAETKGFIKSFDRAVVRLFK